MALKREFVEVNNHKWAFLRFGKGKPIFLLHGFLNYADYYEQLAKLLENDFEVTIPDLPGFGYTKPLEINTYKKVANSLNDFLETLGYKKACFFGTSLGGSILLEFAINFPQKVEIGFVQSALWRKDGIKLNPLEKFEIKLAHLPDFFMEFIQRPATAKFLFKILSKVRPDLGKLFSLYGEKIVESISLLSAKSTKELFFSLQEQDLEDDLRNLRTRTVLIVGKDDQVIPLKETVDLAKRIENDITVVVKNEDHEIILDAPGKLAKIIKEYVLRGKKAVDPAFTWKEI